MSSPTPPDTPLEIPAALWPEVSAAFDAAQDWPVAERPGRLAALAAERPDVAGPLRRMLDALDRPDDLAPADGGLLQRALDDAAQAWTAGRTLGIYRLVAPLGDGGMSSVWIAEQLEGVQRRVALKLPHPGLEPAEALARRFARERDLLAALEHPNIARLYDAGVHGGQPWLAMALVDGESLTAHAARLPLRQRIGLFMQVLGAVRHAHARLIVHRDLKPANILVDRSGQVQLLDFGIAQLLGDDAAAGGVLALTPDSAAPELLAGEPLGVACDIYALGVVLYELLCGERPYRLEPRSPEPLPHQLARTRVAAPSVRGQAAAAGDLDAIVARAMARDPGDRYASVDAMAGDLQAWLDRRPVAARAGGRWYRGRLALRRHAGAVTGAVATVLALAGGLGLALWQAQEARAQADRVAATQRWLIELFEAASPERSGANPPDARRLILDGSARLDAELADQPVLRADLQRLAGDMLLSLQDWPPAAERLGAAVQGYERLGRAAAPEALDARWSLGEALDEQARHDEALRRFDELLALAAAEHGPRDRWQRPVRLRRATVLLNRGDAAGAEAAVAEALALPPGRGEDAARTALNGAYTRALVHWTQGRIAEAAAGFERVVADAPGVDGFPRSNLLMARYRLLTAWGRAGDFARVLDASTPLLADAEALLGPRATLTLFVLEARVQALARQGRYREAVALQREAVQRAQERTGPDDDEQRQLAAGMLGQMLVLAGQADEGLPLLRATLLMLDRRYPQATAFTETWRLMHGLALLRAQRWADARAVLQATLERAEGLQAMDPTVAAEARQALGLVAQAEGRPEAARELLARACPALATVYGPDGPRVWRCRAHAAWIAGLAGEAGALAAFDAVAPRYRASLPPGHVAGAGLDRLRADLVERQDPAAAQRLRAEARGLWTQVFGTPMPERFSGLH